MEMYSLTNDARVNKVVLHNSQRTEKYGRPQRLPAGLQSANDGGDDRDRQRTKQRYQFQDARHDPEDERIVVPEKIETDGANGSNKHTRDQLRTRVGFEGVVDVDHYRLDALEPIANRNDVKQSHSKKLGVLEKEKCQYWNEHQPRQVSDGEDRGHTQDRCYKSTGTREKKIDAL